MKKVSYEFSWYLISWTEYFPIFDKQDLELEKKSFIMKWVLSLEKIKISLLSRIEFYFR